MEIQTRARLVESSFTGGVSTVLPRAEIERAVAEGEFPAWLELRVKRLDAGYEDEAQVAVAWDESELEELLRASDSDGVTLLFDGGDLASALDGPDVEAHGLRERTAVLAIAVMAAGASAGIASAQSQGSKYVPQAGQTVVTVGGDRTTAGIGTAAAKTVESPDAVAVPAGSKYVPQAGQTEVVLGGDERGVAATVADSAPLSQPDAVLVPPGGRYVPTPGQTVFTAPSRTDSGAAAAGSEASASSLSAADDAAIAAGAALLIAAAGFGAAQAGRRPPRPA